MKRKATHTLSLLLVLAMLLGISGTALADEVVGLEDPTVSVTIDGEEVDLADANGDAVEPILVDGTTYLPIRAIAEALGLNVVWDHANREVKLTTGSQSGGTAAVDGAPIAPTTAVSSLDALVSARLNQYFEVGGLRVVKLQEGIYHIDEGTAEHPNGPTNNGSSIYLVIGSDTAAMIDGGNGEVGNANFKDADMAEIVKTLVGGRELKVIITHSHGDHTGLFQDEDSYSVVPRDVPLYICEDDLESLAASVKEKYTVHTLKDGEDIEAGGRTLRVVTMPAHTDGSLALIDYENEVIFTGDTIGSGTVWLFYDKNLAQYDSSVRKLAALVEEMNNPVIYAGHRWQQGDPVVSSAGIAVQEMGKFYVLETVDLLDDIKAGEYRLAETYAPSSDPGNDYPMYSDSDRNQDGIVPGIYALPVAVEGFVPGTPTYPWASEVPEGDAVTFIDAEGSLTAYDTEMARFEEYTYSNSDEEIGDMTYYVYDPTAHGFPADRTYPVALWLHGSGNAALGRLAIAAAGAAGMANGERQAELGGMYIICPLANESSETAGGWPADNDGRYNASLKGILDEVKASRSAAGDILLLAGTSAGGRGVSLFAEEYHDIVDGIFWMSTYIPSVETIRQYSDEGIKMWFEISRHDELGAFENSFPKGDESVAAYDGIANFECTVFDWIRCGDQTIASLFQGQEMGQHCSCAQVNRNLIFDDGTPDDPNHPDGVSGWFRSVIDGAAA